MRVLRLYGAGDLRMGLEPEPCPGPGEVLLRIVSVGICGSDLTWFDSSGIGSTPLSEPLVLGHEFAAVAETGRYAGQLVAVEPADHCGHCERCQEGNPNLCEAVRFAGHAPHDGALRELMTWPEELLFPLPESLSPEDGTMLEPLGVAIHFLDLAKIRLGDRVGVFGCGPIGLLMIRLARLAGASRIVATDVLEHRLATARELGAQTFAATQGQEAEGILKALGGSGLDVVLEAAGENHAVEASMRAVRPGGTVVLGGIPRDDCISFQASEARRKGLVIKMVRRMKHTYPRAIELVRSGMVDVRSLVTKTFPLDQADAAFAMAAARQGLKICIDPSS